MDQPSGSRKYHASNSETKSQHQAKPVRSGHVKSHYQVALGNERTIFEAASTNQEVGFVAAKFAQHLDRNLLKVQHENAMRQ